MDGISLVDTTFLEKISNKIVFKALENLSHYIVISVDFE